MNIKKYVILVFLISTFAIQTPAIRLIDIIYLKDGTNLKGMIVEQVPGKAIAVETDDGSIRTLEMDSILRMEKQRTSADELYFYEDTVFLKDGVIFRGIIIEQIPNISIRLETNNNHIIPLSMEKIWKIAKTKRLPGAEERIADSTESMKLELKIEIAITEAQNMQNLLEDTKKESSDNAAKEDNVALQEEIAALEEKIAALNKEQTRVEEELALENEQLAGIEEELYQLHTGLTSSVDEIARRAGVCDSDERMSSEEIETVRQQINQLINEMVLRAEENLISQLYPNPYLQKLKRKQSFTELTSLINNNLWNKEEYRANIEEMVNTLPLEDRFEIYKENRESDWVGSTIANTIPVFATGSWYKKDYFGALTGTGSMTAGLILFLSGLTIDGDLIQGGSLDFSVWSYAGIGVFTAGYLFSLIEPFLFVNRSNRKLSEVLGISDSTGGKQ
jgi:translation initiation factor IF-1